MEYCICACYNRNKILLLTSEWLLLHFFHSIIYLSLSFGKLTNVKTRTHSCIKFDVFICHTLFLLDICCHVTTTYTHIHIYKKWARFTSKDVLLLIHLEQAGKRKVNTTLLYIFSVSKKVLKVNKENYVCEFLRPLNRLLIKRKPYVLFTYTLLLVEDELSH